MPKNFSKEPMTISDKLIDVAEKNKSMLILNVALAALNSVIFITLLLK